MSGSILSRHLPRGLIVAAVAILSLSVSGGAPFAQSEHNDPNIGIQILEEIIKQQIAPQQPDCPAPGVYSPRLQRCIFPEPEHVSCEPGGRYSAKLGRCVYPEPEHVSCEPPAEYSKRLGRCVYPEPVDIVCEEGQVYSKRLGRCIYPEPKQVTCKFPKVRTSKNTCVCAGGYITTSKGSCIKQEKPKEEVADVTRIQECLALLGYEPGPIDGAAGRATRAAYRTFQTRNGLANRPESFTDKLTLTKLYQLCEAPPEIEVVEKPPEKRRCVPRDLYDMMRAAYGERPDVVPCEAACLPKPVNFSEARLAEIAERDGIEWCDQCIQLGSYLPLRTILQIESAANITLCASPPQLCYLPAPIVERHVETRTIYKTLPVSIGNEGDIAVVVGNEKYAGTLPPHVYGYADADAVVELLVEQLGYRKENIIDLRDATLADLERVFGSADNPNGELYERVSKDEPGDVFVYFSTHGMAVEDGGASYILPVDGDTEELATTAYPLQQLYANLGKTGASTIMLMLEATFGKTVSDLVNPPNLPELEVIAMPEVAVPGLAVFTASDRDQLTLKDPEYGIGLFTRYLIAGLAGEADATPLGNADSRIDSVELYVYTSDMVRTAARKSFGLEQKPLLSKIDNLVVGKLASVQ